MCSAVDRTAEFLQSVQLSRPISTSAVGDLTTNPLFLASHSDSRPTDKSDSGLLPATGWRPTKSDVPQTISRREAQSGQRAIRQRSEFMQMAASIGRDLASTFSKLEQLNNLARNQSLFDDQSSEIQRLTYIVKEDMADLNHRIATLQSISRSQNSKGKQQANHSKSVLMGLQTRLAKMSTQFRGMLEQRSENLRSQAARRGKYTALQNVNENDTTLLTNGYPQSKSTIIPSILLRDDERAREQALNGHGSLLNGGPNPEVQAKLAQQLSLVDQTDTYLASRADTMRSIEHTIVELGEIFQQLATMANESIQRIDMNIEDATTSIEAGHSELLRYLRSISSNRWLMIKVFAVLLIFFVIFVVFFV
ncbi:Syntaxin [Opisthorchis viverrini]|uniref:Syntaxin n=1 Tax=Opisthorchis viverrini TaxID=6198 RepID=A0A1S8X1K7_OPIVI|nr:Syntaxin [Opisthorchis viverrini]